MALLAKQQFVRHSLLTEFFPEEIYDVPAFILTQGVTVQWHPDPSPSQLKKDLPIGLLVNVGLGQVQWKIFEELADRLAQGEPI